MCVNNCNPKARTDGLFVLETLYRDTDPHVPSIEEKANGNDGRYGEVVKSAELRLTAAKLGWAY
jgi:hypothetical protein